MRSLFISILLISALTFLHCPAYGQEITKDPYIKEMRWEKDSRIYLRLLNDSLYVLNTKDLPHISTTGDLEKKEESTYYPVRLSSDYVSFLNSNTEVKESEAGANKTLWSEIHGVIGGGSIHFVHCLTYALETGQLDIKAPLMLRPESKWKPSPVTQTYLQTHKWKYFLPMKQREAQREYKIRKKNGELGDLFAVPPDFLKLFLETSEMKYKKMLRNKDTRSISRIELVKVLLGSRYLGTAQISYIKTQVLKAVLKSSTVNLPSILVFDSFNAAVAMSLDETGYKIRKIVFYNSVNLDANDKSMREESIKNWITKINDQNRENFQKMLKARMK